MALIFAGPVKCPNCDAPLEPDAMICPYCSSAAPARAPWQPGLVFSLISGAVIVAILASDHFFKTEFCSALRRCFQ